VCRYLLRRCDNSPAPWDSSAVGDGAWEEELPEEATKEMKGARDIHWPCGNPHWGFDGQTRRWGWLKSAPVSKEKAAETRKPSIKHEETLVHPSKFMCMLALVMHAILQRTGEVAV
jgi:hypothetical protein